MRGGQPSMRARYFPTAEFSIWTREAGAGGLAIAVEGPSKAEISFEDRKDGSCGVAYVVQEPGTEGRGRGRPGWAVAVDPVPRRRSPARLPPSSLRSQGPSGCSWEAAGSTAMADLAPSLPR